MSFVTSLILVRAHSYLSRLKTRMASSFLFSSLLLDVDSRKNVFVIHRAIYYIPRAIFINSRKEFKSEKISFVLRISVYFWFLQDKMLTPVRCSAAFWFLAISLSFHGYIHPFASLRRLDILWESLRVYIIFPGLRRTFENCNTCPTCRHGRVGKGLWKTLVLQRLSQWNRTALYGNKNAPLHPKRTPARTLRDAI